MSIKKLNKLIEESSEIRRGNLSGKKKHMAKKMGIKTKYAMWKRDGVKDKEPLDFSGPFNREE